MRNALLIFVAATFLMGASPTTEAVHNYVKIPSDALDHLTFWDTKSRKPLGDEIEVSVLDVGVGYELSPEYPRGKANLMGSQEQAIVSCDWETVRHRTDSIYFEEGSNGQLMRGPKSSLAPRFTPLNDASSGLIAAVCTNPTLVKSVGLPSAAAVMKYASTQFGSLDGPPPPLRIPPAPRPGNLPSGPFALSMIDASETMGRAAFLNWASLTRSGNQVTVQSFWVLSRSPYEHAPSRALRDIRYDCDNSTETVITETLWADNGIGITTVDKLGPTLPIKAGSIQKRMLDAVCSGKMPTGTLPSLDAALAKWHPISVVESQ